MIQETLKQQSKLGILTAMYEKFQSAGDTGNADKMKQLIMKVNNEEFIIAFCGHFSAGKSSMINFLLGDQVLPSSPIPTSANTVKVQKGEDYAKVFTIISHQSYFPHLMILKRSRNLPRMEIQYRQ